MRLLMKLSPWQVIAIVVGVVGILSGLLVDPLLSVVGAALIALDGAFVVREFREIGRRRLAYLQVAPRDPHALDGVTLSRRYSGYQRIVLGSGSAIHSSELDLGLWDGVDAQVDYSPEKAPLPPLSRDIAPFILGGRQQAGQVLFNDDKVALRTDLDARSLRGGSRVRLQRTDYFAGEVTNELTGIPIAARATGAVVHDGRTIAESDGILRDLSESVLSNHIGVSTLAITRDDYLILPLQSSVSAQSATALAPSGSGSLDVSDLAGRCGLRSIIVAAMDRELAEECGLPASDSVTRPIGYARLLHRGGKPEFFGLSRVAADLSDVRLSRSEAAFIETHGSVRLPITDPQELGEALDRLLAGRAGASSFLLHLAVLMLRGLVTARGQDVVGFLTGAPEASS